MDDFFYAKIAKNFLKIRLPICTYRLCPNNLANNKDTLPLPYMSEHIFKILFLRLTLTNDASIFTIETRQTCKNNVK